MKLKIRKVKDVPTPKYSREGDAALDLQAAIEAPVTLKPGERVAFGSGIAMEIPANHVGLLFPRGGLGTRGINLANSTGVIDSNYRGEVMITAVNTGVETITLQPLDRVAQLVILPIAVCDVEVVENLEESNRNEGRYGSSGR